MKHSPASRQVPSRPTPKALRREIAFYRLEAEIFGYRWSEDERNLNTLKRKSAEARLRLARQQSDQGGFKLISALLGSITRWGK